MPRKVYEGEIFAGWVEKRGPRADWKWSRRWAVLTRYALLFYEDDTLLEKKLDVPLNEDSSFTPFTKFEAPGESAKHKKARPCGFCIDAFPTHGPDRRLFYVDPRREELMWKWMDALEKTKGPVMLHTPSGTTAIKNQLRILPPTRILDEACILRIFTINNVTDLDNLAHVATCRRQFQDARPIPHKVICVVAGDFMSKSLLSSIDKGKSMVDTFNRAGVNFVCFGTHHQDIPYDDLLKRIQESQFQWVNSNAQRLPLMEDLLEPEKVQRLQQQLPEYAELVLENGAHKRKVALLGLSQEEPSVHTDHSWGGGGAAIFDPVASKFKELQKKLLASPYNYDVVIPMTHQPTAKDRELALNSKKTPLIIGGHDREPIQETLAGTLIVKMGQRAEKIGMIDVCWDNPMMTGTEPTVSIQVHEHHHFHPDNKIQVLAGEHKKSLEVLDIAVLCTTQEGIILSSKDNRSKQTTFGTLVTSTIRNGLKSDCCCLCAHVIKANFDVHEDKQYLSYADLKAQLPYDAEMCTVHLPGSLVSEMVAYSRKWVTDAAKRATGKLPGSFMQIDDGMTWDEASRTITHIRGKPLVPDKKYEVALLFGALGGEDHVLPLMEYVQKNPKGMPTSLEDTRPAKEILIDFFSRDMWWNLLRSKGLTFCQMDITKSGTIHLHELKTTMKKQFGQDVSDCMVDVVFDSLDYLENGVITPAELLRTCILAPGMHRHIDGHFDRNHVVELAKDILGRCYDEGHVDTAMGMIQVDPDGKLARKQTKLRLT